MVCITEGNGRDHHPQSPPPTGAARVDGALFAEVTAHLDDKGITLRSGTLMGATIIDAPSSTKNKAKARDPEMSSTKRGNDWFFGMKAHIGVDAESGETSVLVDKG